MGSLIHSFNASFSSDSYCIILYADDIVVIERVLNYEDHVSSTKFICKWISEKGLLCNNSKSTQTFYAKDKSFKFLHPFVNNYDDINYVNNFKYLGVDFSCDLSFSLYVDNLICKASKRIFILRALKCINAPKINLFTVYDSLILNLLLYAFPLFFSFSKSDFLKIEKIHRRCHNIICGKNHCNCKSVKDIFLQRSKKFFYKCFEPHNILNSCTPEILPSGRLKQPFCKTKRRFNCFFSAMTYAINNS